MVVRPTWVSVHSHPGCRGGSGQVTFLVWASVSASQNWESYYPPLPGSRGTVPDAS